MCHHAGDPTRERWELTEATPDEDEMEEEDDELSFIKEERDVNVELLEADDD